MKQETPFGKNFFILLFLFVLIIAVSYVLVLLAQELAG